jgi:hypothetical protein
VSIRSAADKEFLKTIEHWLESQPELLILVRYSRAAGNKDFEFYSSFESLVERLRRLPPETCVTVFRTPQLPLRGVVDDDFIKKCLSSMPDGSEYAVVDTVPITSGRFSSLNFSAGESHDELTADLENSRGRRVAVGKYPPWQEETRDAISAYVPAQDGKVRPGVY